MRPEPYPASASGAIWSPLRESRYRQRAPLAKAAKPSPGKTAGIAKPFPCAAPVALQVNGEIIGLAVNNGEGFLFFSATHRTDAFDGAVFASLVAIREAAERRFFRLKPRTDKEL